MLFTQKISFFCQSSFRCCIFLYIIPTSQPWTTLLHGLCMILSKSAWLERVKPYVFTPKNQSSNRLHLPVVSNVRVLTDVASSWTFHHQPRNPEYSCRLQPPSQCPTACSNCSTTDKMVTVWCFVDMKIAMMIQMNANVNFDTEWEFHQLLQSNWEGGLDDVTSHT